MNVLWIREQEVADAVSLNDAVDALTEVLPLEAAGGAFNAPKALLAWDGNKSLHALISQRTDNAYCGTKTWINTPDGATAIYALFDAADGTLRAVIEANTLGMLRTAAVSGLASRLLAPAGADELTIIGTGRQAMLQIAAVAVCVPLRKLRIFSPTRENQFAFARRAAEAFDVEIATPETLEEAVEGAKLLTLATRARSPFLHARMLAPEVHINAVGAVLPASAEMHEDVVEAAELILLDNEANVRGTSREFKSLFANEAQRVPIQTLGERIASGERRPEGAGVTIFKSAGMGLSDLAVAEKVFEAASAQGLGVTIDSPTPAKPRWTAAAAGVN